MVYDPLNVLLDFYLLVFCLGFFVSMFISDIGLNFCVCGIFIWFQYQSDGDIIE